MNPLFASLPTTIFEEMSQLALRYGAINLGQGFPDGEGPEAVRRAAAAALFERSNQYPPMMGVPELRGAIAAHYARFGAPGLVPGNILVTSGATEAIAASLFALIAQGDEVLLMEPAYDAYRPLVQRAGGIPRPIRLEPPGWRITADKLARAITPRTRIMMVNTPYNPTGRVFDREELGLVADACIAHDLVAISDEVWEQVVFDGRVHVPLHTLPGMADRTVKIGSAGKIFAMTGWKVGWAVAASDLIRPVARAHQYLTFTTPPALQHAVAHGLAFEPAYFAGEAARHQRSRDRFAAALGRAGLAVLPAEATYFLSVDLGRSGIGDDDAAFCRALVAEAGVAAIPFSAFHAEPPGSRIVRFCFAKDDAILDAAAARIAAFLAR